MEGQLSVQDPGVWQPVKATAGQNHNEKDFELSYHFHKDSEITQVFRVSLLLFHAPGAVTGRDWIPCA